jgi:hypothetical protein
MCDTVQKEDKRKLTIPLRFSVRVVWIRLLGRAFPNFRISTCHYVTTFSLVSLKCQDKNT